MALFVHKSPGAVPEKDSRISSSIFLLLLHPIQDWVSVGSLQTATEQEAGVFYE